MKASISSLVMRPPRPVPGTCARSTLFSLAILRTSGLERTRSRSPASGDSATAPCCWRSSPSFSSEARSAGMFSSSRLSRLRSRSGRGRYTCLTLSSDGADDGVDLHSRAGLDFDVLQRAGSGRRNLGVNLVGGDLKQRFVALDLLAGLLQPLGDGPFKDRLPHLGHDYVCRHIVLPQDVELELRACSKRTLYRLKPGFAVLPQHQHRTA